MEEEHERVSRGRGGQWSAGKKKTASTEPNCHCSLVGAQRLASVRKQSEGERGPGGQRRRGEAKGHAHAREGDEMRRCHNTNGHWTRPLHTERVHYDAINAGTACTGM
ncbi:hypothetical protein VPH35_044350 [Triticum aestivum]